MKTRMECGIEDQGEEQGASAVAMQAEPQPVHEDAPLGLTRAILIDIAASGVETILNFEGGASLSGANGAGKSTLLRLIPIFYGEEPRRVIPTGGGRKRRSGWPSA